MKNSKLISVWEVGRIISDMPTRPTVAFAAGVFNTPESEYTVYPNFLEHLKDGNDLMIVGIFSNEFLNEKESLEKNVTSLETRIDFLSRFKSVDFIVVINKDNDVYDLIKKLRPTEFITTQECAGYLRESHEALERFLSGYTKVISFESRRKIVEVAV